MINVWKYRIENKVIIQNIGIWAAMLIVLGITFSSEISFALVLPLVVPVYLHLFLLDRYYSRKKYLWYVLLTLATIIIFGTIADEAVNSPGIRSRISYF